MQYLCTFGLTKSIDGNERWTIESFEFDKSGFHSWDYSKLLCEARILSKQGKLTHCPGALDRSVNEVEWVLFLPLPPVESIESIRFRYVFG